MLLFPLVFIIVKIGSSNNYVKTVKTNIMLSELNEAKNFLANKFGGVDLVPSGTYAVPTNTSKGPAFMKVVISEDKGMSDFSLWTDEELTQDWNNLVPIRICYSSNIIEKIKIEAEAREWNHKASGENIVLFIPHEDMYKLFYVGMSIGSDNY